VLRLSVENRLIDLVLTRLVVSVVHFNNFEMNLGETGVPLKRFVMPRLRELSRLSVALHGSVYA